MDNRERSIITQAFMKSLIESGCLDDQLEDRTKNAWRVYMSIMRQLQSGDKA